MNFDPEKEAFPRRDREEEIAGDSLISEEQLRSLSEWPWQVRESKNRNHSRPRLEFRRRPLVKVTQTAYHAVLEDLGQSPFVFEKAGLLLGPVEEDDLVTHYVPDRNGHGTSSSFTLDASGLNETLARYKVAQLNCKGVVHAHPPGVLCPSFGDLVYVQQLFANPNNAEATHIILPIVCNGRLYPFVIDSRSPREVLVATLSLI